MLSILQVAILFFIITNPIGMSPSILSVVKHLDIKKQQRILLRESLLALLLAIFFLFLGELFLNILKINQYALSMSGGIILFIISLGMIFSFTKTDKIDKFKEIPFLVPIATPLLTGAGLITMIIVIAKQTSYFVVLSGLLLAWIAVIAVLLLAPYLNILLGPRGLSAVEQLMGMIVCMMGIQMALNAIQLFITTLG